MDKKRLIEVVSLIQNGSDAAKQELYLDSSKSVYFLALKMLRNTDDAEDMTQDVFITVFEKINELWEPASYYRWLNLITANKCTNLLTRRRELPGIDCDEAERFDMEEDDTFFLPERSFDDAETRRMIMEIVEALPTPQRLCILYYYYQQLTIAQIAENLDCSEGTVKSRLSLARAKIRQELERKNKEEGIRLYGVPMALTPVLGQALQDYAMPMDAMARMWNTVLNATANFYAQSGPHNNPSFLDSAQSPTNMEAHSGVRQNTAPSGAHDAPSSPQPARTDAGGNGLPGQTAPQNTGGSTPLSRRIPSSAPRAENPSASARHGAHPGLATAPSGTEQGFPQEGPASSSSGAIGADTSGNMQTPEPQLHMQGNAPLSRRIPSAPPRMRQPAPPPASPQGLVGTPESTIPPRPSRPGFAAEPQTPPLRRISKTPGAPKSVGLILCSLLLICATIGLSLHAGATGAFGKVFGDERPSGSSSEIEVVGISAIREGSFPVGAFVREDNVGALVLDEFDKKGEGGYRYDIRSINNQDEFNTSGISAIVTDFTPTNEHKAMAVIDTEYGPLELYALSDYKLLLQVSGEWRQSAAHITDPEGIYVRDGFVGTEEKTPKPITDEKIVSANFWETDLDFIISDGWPLSLKLDGLYEIVDSGIADESAFMDHYTALYRSKGVAESDIAPLTDALRILLADHMLGTVGSVQMTHHEGWIHSPGITEIIYESHGRITTIGEFYKAYVSSHNPDVARISKIEVGYEFGEGRYAWTDSPLAASSGIGFQQTLSENGSALHICGVMTLLAEVEEAHLDRVELDMDIFRREDGSVDADGYLTIHTKASEYITYHLVLGATLGRVNDEPVKPQPRAYITFVDRAAIFGDKLCIYYDQALAEQPDGTWKVVLTRKGMEGFVPVTVDLYTEARDKYVEKQAKMLALGVQTP